VRRIAFAAGIVLATTPANGGTRPVDVPAGTLAEAIVALGSQTDASIGISDPGLATVRVPSVRGRLSAERALRRLLQGTDARLVRVDERTFRIARRRRPPLRAGPSEDAPGRGDDIVVTAGRRPIGLRDYPGGIVASDAASLRPGEAARGTDALVAREPILASTHLGPGRNKLFIRGIADSSFNGPTQSTVGEYLGEVRLNYSAPDPDLALYDVARVEVLEGPQGTLYGAGSLGGIMRLVPVEPDLSRLAGALTAGGALVAGGASEHDASAVANVPLATDRLGLRAVAYENVEGGYIDDAQRGLGNVNRTEIYGGRATLRFQPGPSWTFDLGGVIQNISSRDGAYAERGLPPLERRSVIAQPFDNDYSLGSVVVRHRAGRVALVSATSAVFHDVGSTYDASPSPAAPARYSEDDGITLLGNETRASLQNGDGSGWVIGTQLLHNRSRIRRTLGALGSEPAIAGTLNTVDEAAIYGEGTIRLGPRLLGTLGGRLAYDHLVGQVIDEAGKQPEIRRREISALPSVGILLRVNPVLNAYARYQKGYRPGGLSVQAGRTERFEADGVSTWEAGIRYGSERGPVDATLAASYARWSDIQADLVDVQGLPFTANIGSGHVLALEARGRWRPSDALSIQASALASDSSLARPAAAFAGEEDATLPNIADVVARIQGRLEVPTPALPVAFTASAGYVGRSRLGVGPGLDIDQGRYLDLAAGVEAPLGPLTVTLDATNLANARRNVFAFGNPFGVRRGDQVTPLRPRTLRLGFSAAF
jgi:outer membrane receptor protein involved in Fe transport